ncbi:GNAT family N-acetyltransferase [Ferruginibacter sp. HRS2-29]|uniref:GNAT family N-acetyltransferase n=1 Tax=Ferruginibacter sp. HRS2-29 TaxID=2487334 RepID=UPI0020CD497E|nr:GNAT family protein [Ferruginibacter sp. HRS2-29]MCP9752731.1 N-acetyltransferase [Ferruginibacter sp. HRS2-29]
MTLHTSRLSLSAISVGYLDAIHELHSLPETDEFNTLGIPASIEVTKQVVENWIQLQQADPRAAYTFCVSLAETNEFIGLIGLKPGKANYRIAEVWFKTHPAFWRKGYTSEALAEILRFGFAELTLHRIEAGCAVGNRASIRVLEKAGFTREGRKREILPIRGKWVDNFFYSILEKEFGATDLQK